MYGGYQTMQTQASLTEAATYLGVSKATLRNWDNEGKLIAQRHPINGYRVYDLNDLTKLRNSISCIQLTLDLEDSPNEIADSKAIRRMINKINSIFRDSDANSNMLSRFDEVSKLLFLKLYSERNGDNIFYVRDDEDLVAYSTRIKSVYQQQISLLTGYIPDNYKQISASNNCIYKCGLELSKCFTGDSAFDVKGLAYEDMIKGTFDKSDNQQFFTPHQIVSFMVKMLKPYIKGTICDPACGTAGFLTQISKQHSNVHLVGMEIDERLAWISKMNLLIHGSEHFSIECLAEGGTLGCYATAYYDSFDAILTNPPFGSDYTEQDILDEFTLGKGRASRRRGILFIERAWSLLKENGVMGIIIDQGVLNSHTTSDVRKFILSHFRILSIVDLPETAFMPYANVSSSILFLQKASKPVKSDSVFFAKSECIGRKPNGDDDIIYSKQGEALLNSDLETIVDNWEAFCNGKIIDKNSGCYIADISSSSENDSGIRLDYAFHHPFRNISKNLLEQAKHPLIPIADLCVERNISYIPSSDTESTTILFTGLANIESNSGVASQVSTPAASIKSAVKRYEKEDIVFSKMRPNLRKIAVMNFDEGGYVSSECVVLTVKKDSDGRYLMLPELLAAILRSDLVYGQILHHVTGIGRPRIGTSDIRQVKIPLVPYEIQEQNKVVLEGKVSIISQLRSKAKSLSEEADAMEISVVNELANKLTGVN
jgi:type I restriction-modification system DNA methylase subunit